MEGTDPKEKLRGTYWEALKKNWMVWPLVQAVNFRFVPLVHRVLVVNVVSLGEFVPGGRWKGAWGGGEGVFVGFRGCRKGGGFWLRGEFADVFACL